MVAEISSVEKSLAEGAFNAQLEHYRKSVQPNPVLDTLLRDEQRCRQMAASFGVGWGVALIGMVGNQGGFGA